MKFSALLAADISDVLWVLFVFVAMISGLINKFKENRAADEMRRRRAQRRDRPAGSDLQDEITEFLEELGTGTPKPQRDARSEKVRDRRARQRHARRQREFKNESGEPSGRKQRRESDISRVRDRHVQSSVHDRHVQSEVHNRHLKSDISAQNRTATAAGQDSVSGTTATGLAASGLPAAAQMLRRREGLASAIILNEILSPPVSRRSRRPSDR